jgi:hypothetical protein
MELNPGRQLDGGDSSLETCARIPMLRFSHQHGIEKIAKLAFILATFLAAIRI